MVLYRCIQPPFQDADNYPLKPHSHTTPGLIGMKWFSQGISPATSPPPSHRLSYPTLILIDYVLGQNIPADMVIYPYHISRCRKL